MKFPNLEDSDQAGIHVLDTPDAPVCLIRACEASGLPYFVIDMGDVVDKAQLLTRFAEALKFPDYFGHNWDALYDALCDRAWLGNRGLALHLKHTASFEKRAADDWLTLHEILEAAIDDWRGVKRPFWVFVDGAKACAS